jgi:hypothetical protein
LDPTRALRDKKSCPKVFDVDNDVKQVDITHGNQVSRFGEHFQFHTIIREDIFIGQKVADFDINLSFSNLPTSICRRIAKSLELMKMKLKIGGTVQDSTCTRT